MDGVLNLPDFPLGTPTVGGRIHDDGVVMIASADFPLHKLHAIVHNPSDGLVCQSGGMGVFFRPSNHAFGGVHMGHSCPGLSRRQGGAAGVGEEI